MKLKEILSESIYADYPIVMAEPGGPWVILAGPGESYGLLTDQEFDSPESAEEWLEAWAASRGR